MSEEKKLTRAEQIEQFVKANAVAKRKGALGHARDAGLSLLSGAVSVPETAVGLADIVSGGQAGKFLENEGGAIGFRPKEAKEAIAGAKTEMARKQLQDFQEAEGLGAKFGQAYKNPSLVTSTVLESLPAMGAGGVIGRGLGLAAKGISPVAAGALGEGAVGAGLAAEQIRQQTEDGLLTDKQAALAAATGVTTAGFGYAGGRIAKKLGLGDADTLLAGGTREVTGTKGMPRRVLEGAITEGLFEELPQSVSEQILQNEALGKPLDEGVEDAVVLGLLSGGLMGAGAGLASRGRVAPTDDGSSAVPPTPAGLPPPSSGPNNSGGPTPGLDDINRDYFNRGQGPDARGMRTLNPDPELGFNPNDPNTRGMPMPEQPRLPYGDGSLSSAADVSASTDSPVNTGTPRLGFNGRPAEPTAAEKMGVDETRGSLSAAAALAVNTGAAPQVDNTVSDANTTLSNASTTASDANTRSAADKRAGELRANAPYKMNQEEAIAKNEAYGKDYLARQQAEAAAKPTETTPTKIDAQDKDEPIEQVLSKARAANPFENKNKHPETVKYGRDQVNNIVGENPYGRPVYEAPDGQRISYNDAGRLMTSGKFFNVNDASQENTASDFSTDVEFNAGQKKVKAQSDENKRIAKANAEARAAAKAVATPPTPPASNTGSSLLAENTKKATKKDGSAKYFLSDAKSQNFIAENNIGDTHEVMERMEGSQRRFEIQPKAQTSEANQTSEAQPIVSNNTEASLGGKPGTRTTPVKDEAKASGKTYTADNDTIPYQWDVVDAADLVSSHSDTFGKNPDFPSDYQPRDRANAGYQAQVLEIQKDFNPELLGESAVASDGSPIIGSADNIVESGNGRTIAIRRVYAEGKGEAYKEFVKNNAEKYGLDADTVAGMNEPVLVRRNMSDMDRATFTRKANKDSTAALSSTERARVDANALPDTELLEFDKTTGNLNMKASRSFTQKFVSALGSGETASLVTPTGELSQTGQARVSAALLHNAYKSDKLTQAVTEIVEPTAKNVLNTLTNKAPQINKLNQQIKEGKSEANTLANDIKTAAEKYIDLVETGTNIDTWLGNNNLFSEDAVSPEVADLISDFYDNSRSQVAMGKAIQARIDFATNAGKTDLLGEVPATAPVNNKKRSIVRGKRDAVNNNQKITGQAEWESNPAKARDLAKQLHDAGYMTGAEIDRAFADEANEMKGSIENGLYRQEQASKSKNEPAASTQLTDDNPTVNIPAPGSKKTEEEIPKTLGAGKDKRTFIGKNTDGDLIYENKNGIRSKRKGAFMASEPVKIQLGNDENPYDTSNRPDEFKTADEMNAPTQIDAAIISERESYLASKGVAADPQSDVLSTDNRTVRQISLSYESKESRLAALNNKLRNITEAAKNAGVKISTSANYYQEAFNDSEKAGSKNPNKSYVSGRQANASAYNLAHAEVMGAIKFVENDNVAQRKAIDADRSAKDSETKSIIEERNRAAEAKKQAVSNTEELVESVFGMSMDDIYKAVFKDSKRLEAKAKRTGNQDDQAAANQAKRKARQDVGDIEDAVTDFAKGDISLDQLLSSKAGSIPEISEAVIEDAEVTEDTPAKEKEIKDRFANNTFFDSDTVAAARARIKSKMGRVNSGIDPEMLTDGAILAGAYIESGVRKFGEYAKIMIDDLSKNITPYLLTFWNGARDYPGFDSTGMTNEVDSRAQFNQLMLEYKPSKDMEAVLGEDKTQEKPKRKVTKPTNKDVMLRQDWGVKHIDGYVESDEFKGEQTDYGVSGGVKDAFLKDSKAYLTATKKHLESLGYTMALDRKGKPMKVNVNESGPATSGEVSLSMQKDGSNIHVSIGQSSVPMLSIFRDMNADGTPVNNAPHPQQVAVMYRTSMNDGDTYATKQNNSSGNIWLSHRLTATELAEDINKTSNAVAARAKLKNSDYGVADIDKRDDAGEILAFLTDTEDKGVTTNDDSAASKQDQGGAPAVRATGSNTQQANAQDDTGNVEARQSTDDGATKQTGNTGRSIVRGAGKNVASESGLPSQRNAADGRKGTSGEGPSNAGTGERTATDGGTTSPAATAASATDLLITNPLEIVGGTPVQRFNKNKEALQLMQQLEIESRQATPAEQRVLAGYIGWGSFGQELFQGTYERQHSSETGTWQERGQWLRETLGESAWKSAQRSITNAHYTDPPTVMAMWAMVERMGFEGGRVLEPSMGTGNFFSMMPPNVKARSQLTGIELDEATGAIAKQLFPQSNIRVMGYQDSKTPDNFYDVVIGNYPFENTPVADRRYNKLNPMLHDYFFLKSMDQVRPGGLVISITSTGTMDKQNSSIRRELAKQADLVAAIRLPSGAFKDYAGTSVVTDIVILRKRQDKAAMVPEDATWVNVADYKTPSGEVIKLSQYYIDNPQNVIGTIDFGSGTTKFGAGMIVKRPANMDQRLQQAIELIPENAIQASNIVDHLTYYANATGERHGSLFTNTDGDLMIALGDQTVKAEQVAKYDVKSKKTTDERESGIKAAIELRLKYSALADKERAGDEAETERKELKRAYNAFVKDYGKLRESYALKYMERVSDPFYFELVALENDDGTPATVMSKSTTRGKATMENPSVRDAYVLARNKSVNPTLKEIAELAGKPESEIRAELKESGAVFEAANGDIVPSDIYLSGNVRQKLREAQAALKDGNEAMKENVAALQQVMPVDIPYFNIETKLGATWIPSEAYQDYVAHMLGKNSAKGIEVSFLSGRWRVALDKGMNSIAEARTNYGTGYYPFSSLVQAAFSNQVVRITRRIDGEDVYDGEASAEANARIAKMRDDFGEWLWSDLERRVDLEKEYNEARNAWATPKYDGSFLTFEGMALTLGKGEFNLRKHQQDAIWRAIVNRRSINAHEVGTGKTFTMAGIAIESRRYGIAKKPVLFAHNANSGAVAEEIRMMYPAARVLYINNLEPKVRDIRLRQIANDDWDVIVLPHSLLDRMTLSEDTLMSMAADDIAGLEQEFRIAAKDEGINENIDLDDEDTVKRMRGGTAKELAKARKRIIETIKKQAQKSSKEGAVTFEDLGIDMILVDEVHEFKKPPIVTRMNMKGLNTQLSQKSIQLQLLTRYVRQMNNGGNIHTFTGTPITNTITEIYHQMRYVMDMEMQEATVSDWDGWFGSFATEVQDVELSSAGDYEMVTRLAGFVNVPELRQMIGQYMDTVFAEDMPEMQPRKTKSGKVMSDELTELERSELLNGRTEGAKDRPYKKVINDTVDMTAEQKRIFSLIQGYATEWRDADSKTRKEWLRTGDHRTPLAYGRLADTASFDVRLLDPSLVGMEGKTDDDPDSKASRTIAKTIEVYSSHKDAAQVIFTEKGYGTKAKRSGGRNADGEKNPDITVGIFSTVLDMVERLVQGGIPREQIAVVTGATSKDKRSEIAAGMNDGTIRVVIGSTQTLGVGVNMQRNLRAMHHMDAPFMPGMLEQRNGRGQRQGNQWNTVYEYRYMTDRLDGKRWQILAVKQRFITAFMKSDGNMRTIEGDAVAEEENDIMASFAEAAGDPRILQRVKLQKKLEQLNSKERLHTRGIADMRKAIRSANDRAAREQERLDKLNTKVVAGALEVLRENFSVVIGAKTYTKRADATEAMKEYVKENIRLGDQPKSVGKFAGTELFVGFATGSTDPRLYLKLGGHTFDSVSLAGLESVMRNFPNLTDRIAQDIEDAKTTVQNLKKVVDSPFARKDELTRVDKQIKDLEADLALNPVPPPAWLRQGAPIDSEVFYGKTPFIVTGHQYSKDGYFVTAEDSKGNMLIPYLEAKDSAGMELYEEKEFVAPEVITKPKDEKDEAKTDNDIDTVDFTSKIRSGDIDTGTFVEVFGLKGVVATTGTTKDMNESQQAFLNETYDSLLQMAEMLEIPTEAIGLGGQLTINIKQNLQMKPFFTPIGSEGATLNLNAETGVLAHEWFHALDNHFTSFRGAENRNTTRLNSNITLLPEPQMVLDMPGIQKYSAPQGSLEAILADRKVKATDPNSPAFDINNWKIDPDHPKGVRPVVEKAFAKLVDVLSKSEMRVRSTKLDQQQRKNGYWSSTVELAARGFESFLKSKMVNSNSDNENLVRNLRTEFETHNLGEDLYHYATEVDSPAINEAFGELFDTIETKPTGVGKSQTLYSRTNQAKGRTNTTRQQVINKLYDKFGKATIDKLIADGTLDIKVLNDYVVDGKLSIPGDVGGIYHRGRATLIADNLSDTDIIPTFIHELGGHGGLQTLMTKKSYDALMRDFDALVKAGDPMALKAKAQADAVSNNQEEASDEYLAYLITYASEQKEARGGKVNSLINRITMAIRSWLKNTLGVPIQLNSQEILALAEHLISVRANLSLPVAANNTASNNGMQFSRAAGMNDPFDPINVARETKNRFHDWVSSAPPGKLSWWHKTVGTMYNLAERNPFFKPVFDHTEKFINDVSFYASKASEFAPRLLPKLDSLKDFAKTAIGAKDNDAISKPIFEGTLLWGRDSNGEAVLIDEWRTRVMAMSRIDRLNELRAGGYITPAQETKLASLNAMQATRFINGIVDNAISPGLVWTDSELRDKFSLSDSQIELYKEFRSATDNSLDSLTRSDMLRKLGKDATAIEDDVMSAPNLRRAVYVIEQHINSLSTATPAKATALAGTLAEIKQSAARTNKLKADGYAPLSRFGQYTVDVVDANGNREYFGMFESAYDARKMADEMKDLYGANFVTQGALSNEEFKMFAGVTPETAELFGEMLGLNATGDNAADQAFQEFLKRTKNNRSAMKRLMHRKGIKGYSEDVGRVLASFIYSNARHTSAGLNMGNLDRSIADIPKGEGQLKDAAVKLAQYIKNPQEEGHVIRGFMFAQYLGGSIASAVVNLTQPIAVSFPYLSQFGGAAKAAAALAKASNDWISKTPFATDLQKAIEDAEADGTLSPQEVHNLLKQARGDNPLRAGDGTKYGNSKAFVQNGASRLGLMWGSLFSLAEQINRRVTFVAAYRMAQEQGISDPAGFARKSIKETQFVYNKASRMQWGRGAIGGTLLTFKTYSVSYIELMHRLWNQGEKGSVERKAGRKAAWIMIATLFMLSGAGGLPFMEDMEDLIDGAGQILGYNFSSRKKREEAIDSIFGEMLGDFMESGISGIPGAPTDVSGRLGMDNLIPGTGIFKQRTSNTKDLLELAGPAGDFVGRVGTGTRSILKGAVSGDARQVGRGALELSPVAVRNAVKGADMLATGTYKDTKGYKVDDVTPIDSVFKAIGFQPKDISKTQGAAWLSQSGTAYYNLRASEIRALWAQGISEGNKAKVKDAQAALADWNKKNPNQVITIRPTDIQRRIREMNMNKSDRVTKLAPKTMRAQIQDDFANARGDY